MVPDSKDEDEVIPEGPPPRNPDPIPAGYMMRFDMLRPKTGNSEKVRVEVTASVGKTIIKEKGKPLYRTAHVAIIVDGVYGDCRRTLKGSVYLTGTLAGFHELITKAVEIELERWREQTLIKTLTASM